MKTTLNYILFSILAVAFFTSCISSSELNYLQPISKQYPMQAFENYKLEIGDMITCSISSNDPELVGTFNMVLSEDQNALKAYRIYEDSTVIIPFFGTAKIANYTVQEAEVILQKMMQESVKDVQVKVSMANNNFYIYANDRRGTYPVYKDNLTIYQALAMAQQTSGTMDLSKVKILRKGEDGNTREMQFDLRTQDVIQSEYYYIQPNDYIYFPTNKNAFFNINSLSSFTSMLSAPLMFFLYSITYNF
ncbi:MAG: polysaccharide biosynthesis/export family protein [Dysgonomonas sp.]